MTKEKIKEVTTMGRVLERYGIRVNRAGFIVCPFHQEKTPSMKIYKDSYYCFGCGAHGDIFSFVMQYENVPFSVAFTELGGTYIDRKGKSREQIRHEIRDAKDREGARQRTEGAAAAIAQSQKDTEQYAAMLKILEPGTDAWYEVQYLYVKELGKNAGEGGDGCAGKYEQPDEGRLP